ncbi:MAG: haloacid dehalogenase type II [Gammaproteobacteria bacterium]|nr:haloacid dehalogenase type II [Gammaproteobacteria bacterium]
MATTLAFDVYGTLIDTFGIHRLLANMLDDSRAKACANRWREKQLEYSFRRGLMDQYQPFPVCTRDALEFTCEELELPLTAAQKHDLMESYRTLPAFPDVKPALALLQPAGHRMYPFSNGPANEVTALLDNAGLLDYFLDIISVDEVQTFKPAPAVYRHFLARSGAEAGACWLISGNPFDVLGAAACGMRTAWLKRNPKAVFDPWGREPDHTLTELTGLATALLTP